jgi:hypothetical protein
MNLSGITCVKLVMVEMVLDVRELLLHFFFEVVEGNLSSFGFSLVCVVVVTMVDEV